MESPLEEIKERTQKAKDEGFGHQQFDDLDSLIAEVELFQKGNLYAALKSACDVINKLVEEYGEARPCECRMKHFLKMGQEPNVASLPTNFQDKFGTPEKVAEILMPMLPTMEVFCKYCDHWINDECEVNPHWDCKNALIHWLNSPAVPEKLEKS